MKPTDKLKGEMAPCVVCGRMFVYNPMMCCNGYECACMGQPTNPQVCSGECMDKIYPAYVPEDVYE